MLNDLSNSLYPQLIIPIPNFSISDYKSPMFFSDKNKSNIPKESPIPIDLLPHIIKFSPPIQARSRSTAATLPGPSLSVASALGPRPASSVTRSI